MKAYIFIFKVFFEKVWRNKDPGVERPPKRKFLMWRNNAPWRAMQRFYHRINTSSMYFKFMQAHRHQRQSNEFTRGPSKVSSALSFTGEAGWPLQRPVLASLVGREYFSAEDLISSSSEHLSLCTPYTSLKISFFMHLILLKWKLSSFSKFRQPFNCNMGFKC
jgi:hypothetical protein